MRVEPHDSQTASAPAPNGRSGIFYGWWVLAASAVLGFGAFGVVIPGYLAFSVPIRTELELSSGQSAFIVGAAWGIGDITSLVAGWLADRYGARRLVLVGGLLCGIGFAGLAFAGSFWAIVLSYTVAASVGRGLGIFPTLMTVANQWFEDRKALALAIVNTAVTGGAAAILPALSYASGEIGWRTVALIAGGVVCALTLPAAAIIRSRPEDIGLEPYGSGRPARQASRGAARRTRATGTARREYSVRQALATLSFCALALGAILRTVPSDGVVINQIPILIWKGVAETRTSTYLSITYFATIPARFGMGLAATWVSPRLMLSLAMAVVTLCTVAALGVRGDAAAWFLIISSAAGQGVSSLAWITVGEYFGRRSFGTLVGLMTVFYGVSGLIVPALAGAAFDRTGSFVPVLLVVGILQAVSAGSFALVKRPAADANDDEG
ncbi:MAG: MFS transporter [Chloroflexi bacterium]|nr:MFS transporter [Chloroflexota bacterium]